MEGQQLIGLVNLLVINAQNWFPGSTTALGCGEILNRMERKRAEVRNIASHLAMPFSAKGMGTVSHYRHSAHSLLNCISRLKQRLPGLHDLKYLVVIADNAT